MLRSSPGEPIITHVGRLATGKGQLELLEAASDLIPSGAGVSVLFVGAPDPSEPDYAAQLESRAIELGIADAVHMLGHRTDVIQIVAGSDVLVMSSIRDPVSGWREGFGLAALEAMAVGTPVVGYAEAAVPEVVGDAGVLVPTGDRQALARAIRDVISDSELAARLAERGRARADGYRLEAAAGRMRELYAELAAQQTN
jgi:glycosyltransferase involved in cell wall biosynthesis